MWKSSEEEDFERASRLRDEIKSLETTALKQRISFSGMTSDKDVVALSRSGEITAATVFHVREGNVIGSEKFIIDGSDTASKDSQIVSAFLKQYYTSDKSKAVGFPEEVVLPIEIEDTEDIITLVQGQSKNASGKLKITYSKNTEENAKLAKLAQENSDSLLKYHESKDEVQKREKLRALKDLKEALDLGKIPRRIECFDISNIHGDEAVGAMTVFTDGFPNKSQYRKFKIKTVQGIDDYSMMAEMISRRFKRLAEHVEPTQRKWADDPPDLVVIDGGRGHLNAALNKMREDGIFGVPTVALAKKEELVFLPQRTIPLRLARDSEALHILQYIRDQAHRFGITYHRKLRSGKITSSKLDDVKGIGEKRKRNLLAHFGSVEAIKRSSAEEISQVARINKKLATAIVESLNSQLE
jgi:excinuclease ABC subunit C